MTFILFRGVGIPPTTYVFIGKDSHRFIIPSLPRVFEAWEAVLLLVAKILEKFVQQLGREAQKIGEAMAVSLVGWMIYENLEESYMATYIYIYVYI